MTRATRLSASASATDQMVSPSASRASGRRRRDRVKPEPLRSGGKRVCHGSRYRSKTIGWDWGVFVVQSGQVFAAAMACALLAGATHAAAQQAHVDPATVDAGDNTPFIRSKLQLAYEREWDDPGRVDALR